MPLEEDLYRLTTRIRSRRPQPWMVSARRWFIRPQPAPGSRRARATSAGRTAQMLVTGFAVVLALGTAALMLPFATPGPGHASFMEALFTATSSLCLTGLIVVDTPTYWTTFGQVVILALIQIGGFGVMTFATMIGIFMSRRFGLGLRVAVASETRSTGPGEMRHAVKRIVFTIVAVETAVALLLAARFATGYGYSPGKALWHGVFHSISGFNNAGFALYTANLMDFDGDPLVLLPIAAAVIVGGLGFPVIVELLRHIRVPRLWSMTTRMMVVGTPVLLLGGTAFLLLVEWGNPTTLGPMGFGDKLLNAFFQSTITRTAGFNSVDLAGMHPVAWFGMDFLMLVGGGSAGTAGGLRITTVLVLLFVAWTEVRGQQAVNVLGRRLSRSVQREALTIVVLSMAILVTAQMGLMLLEPDLGLDRLLFESVSAFATVGLSTGITAQIGTGGQLILIALMFIGRLGPTTIAAAIAAQDTTRTWELPKERPLIG
ncbi:TrkH family potassium uptake protein [Kocuria soli]|nr:potassium transporter TrkG [Kocuria soli]